MQLHEPTLANRLGKLFAPGLARIVCSPPLYSAARAFDAYLNFLMGKGSGTGWDLRHEVEAAIARIHRKEPVVFDIGANVGCWSQQLLNAIPDAKLFMFDPSPACQSEIRRRELTRATLIPCAVGEAAGRATLYFSSETDGAASLHMRRDSYFQGRTYGAREVEVTTIDTVIDSEGVAFVDFMKMDIEGHELFALRGAQNALESRKIGALSFEFGSGNINSRTYFRDLWTLLKDAGFQMWRVAPAGMLISVDHYYEDCEYFRGATNYIAELRDHVDP